MMAELPKINSKKRAIRKQVGRQHAFFVGLSVAIMAIVLTAFLSALSTGSFGVAVVRERVTAENIARLQLEHVKETGFIADTDHYTPTTISPIGYGATISATTIYTGVQLITVTVLHNGPVFTIGNYKVNRGSGMR